MLVLWLTTGVAAAQEGVEPPVEQRGKGGSGKGWRLRGEHQYQAEEAPEQAVSVETIREAAKKVARKTKPAEPAPVEIVMPAATPTEPTRQVATLFEPPAANVVPIERPAPPERPLTETERAALGAQKIERTYDLELLLLMAA